MQFVKYPSLINTFKGDEVDYVRIALADKIKDLAWHVYEKVHGANFSMWTDGNSVKFAKRTGFLNNDSSFFNHKEIVEKYTPNLLAMYSLVGKPIVIYGELFGGKYNNKCAGTLVQREVQYCPHNDFVAFDIATINDDSSLSFLEEDEFQDTAFAAGFRLPPYIGFYYSLDEALSIDNKFITRVPEFYNLISIPDNYAEGVVIKPAKNLFDYRGGRIVFKNKNELFKEEKSVDVAVCTSDEFIKFFNELKYKITPARFNNVISKHGLDLEPKFYFQEFLRDCLDECNLVPYDGFTENQKRLLNKLVARFIWPIIKDRLDAQNRTRTSTVS